MPDAPLRGRHTRGLHEAARHEAGDPAAPSRRPAPRADAANATDAPGLPRNNPRLNAERAARGRHGGLDRTAQAPAPGALDPGLTGAIPVIGRHVGLDRTDPDGTLQQQLFEFQEVEQLDHLAEEEARVARHAARRAEGAQPAAAAAEEEALSVVAEERSRDVGASAALISICVIISRITGFARTWAMAFALGATFVSSSYQVANNLPNMLYELVMGGMLVTAFLPVYLSVKKKLGQRRGNAYASNLLTIVVLLLGVVSALCMLFPAQVVFTQTFYSDQQEMALSVFFFQFFAIQIVFYGCSSIISGLLNANREYFWSSIAPVFNNLIVIASFLAYAAIAQHDQVWAFYAIAIGNPLGVFVQMAIQVPALRRNGIRIRPRIDLRDPALRETLALGAPAVFVTVCSFATVSAQNAASYCFADNGPSVIAYARLWFTFPYSFLAVPVTTAMFTELSDMQADGDERGLVRGIIDGTAQIVFLMVPMALYLVVFATPLVTLYHIGAFTEESIGQIARYLAVMAVALPFYGVNAYLNKIFSSIRRMGVFSLINFVAVAAQVAVTLGAAWAVQHGYPATLEAVAASTVVSYVLGDLIAFMYLRRHYGRMGLGFLAAATLRSLGLGALGAAAGAGVLAALQLMAGPLSGSIAQALAYLVVGGLVALAVTFGPAVRLRLPEAAFVTGITDKLGRRLRR
ncbi:MAG: murein biosynthesis integral membrane protein MurJ [Eggerthellaceae bacterium]|nr:murein biosynthesis integral membrane protein MurJ [Eggerthellaceae bacterium]